MRFSKSFAAVVAILISCETSYADAGAVQENTQATNATLGKSDIYAGCVFSIAIPLMHNGLKLETASGTAFARCKRYSYQLDETELEGISDYVNLILEKIEKK